MLQLLAAALLLPIQATGNREDRDGWIVLHLQGSPKEIGFQHGSLAALEVDDAIKACGAEMAAFTGKAWSWYRQTARTIFWPKLDKEYQDEIAAIAAGVQSKGFKDDADDVLALNAYIEISGYYLPKLSAGGVQASIVSGAPMACSAFVATGSETRDGKVVMGHNFWWDYLMGERWRVILDIKPASGHRLMMDACPGLIDSGTDWAINDAGMALCETTISNFVGFDENGIPEFQRMRKAIQYSESLKDMASIFKQGNNGGYANAWLMADTKTGEIGKLELGLKNVVFSTSRDGYFFGSNFPEDPKLMQEEAPKYKATPRNNCEERRVRWKALLDQDKGKVDADTAKGYLSDLLNGETNAKDGRGGALCGKFSGSGAVNAKVLTSESVAKMQFWARMGVPDGSELPRASITPDLPDSVKPFAFDLKAHDWSLISAR